jgi:predicted nicotinamide N-methyase
MGLVGLLCAQLGAASVLLTDYEPAVLAHLGQNAALNGLQQCCASQYSRQSSAPVPERSRDRSCRKSGKGEGQQEGMGVETSTKLDMPEETAQPSGESTLFS